MDLVDKAKNFVGEKLAEMEKPEASITDVDVKGFGLDGMSYHAKIDVKNPYPVPIPICEIKYELKSDGRVIASGTIPDPGSLKGKDTTTIDVPVKVPHSVVVSLVRDIGSDWDIDYQIDMSLIIDLPVFGNFTIPLSQSGEFKLPSLSDMLWKKSDASAEAETAKQT